MDDVISRYPGDTTITSFVDASDGLICVNTISFVIGLNLTCTKMKMNLYQDWGPGKQLAQVTYTLYSNTGNPNDDVVKWQTFTNVDSQGNTISNAYTACHTLISTKFLFWYFCDQNGLTLS